MKTLSFLKAAFMIAAIPFLLGCEKEPLSELQTSTESALGKGKQVERPFKGRMVTSTSLVGDEAAGYTPGNLLPAWYPGFGEGNATHIGKFSTFFNQYAATIEGYVAQGAGAPITMFFTGDLLGLFTEAEVALMAELGVSSVIYDRHGNSIWSTRVAGTSTFTLVPPAQVLVYQESVIVGGTGRFAGASGYYKLWGDSELNLPHPSQDVLQVDGVIVY